MEATNLRQAPPLWTPPTEAARLHVSLTSEFARLIGLEAEGDDHEGEVVEDNSSDVASIVSNASSSGRSVVRGTFVFLRDPPPERRSETLSHEQSHERPKGQVESETEQNLGQTNGARAAFLSRASDKSMLEELDDELFSEFDSSMDLFLPDGDDCFQSKLLTSISEEEQKGACPERGKNEGSCSGTTEGLRERLAALEQVNKKLRRKEAHSRRKVGLLQLSNRQLKGRAETAAGEAAAARQRLVDAQEAHSSKIQEKDSTIQHLQGLVNKFKGECDLTELVKLSVEELQGLQSTHMEAASIVQQALTKKLLEEKRRMQDSRLCVICLDSEITTVCVPCGHQVMCEMCAAKVEVCPLDRQKIQQRIRAYGK